MLRRSAFICAIYAFSFVLTNFGMAMAARIPMITTTMSSSISVKPRCDLTAWPSTCLVRPHSAAGSARVPPIVGREGCNLQEPCSALGLHPILSDTETYHERDPQIGRPFHVAFYQFFCAPLLRIRHLEDELVMHLQQHPRPQAVGPQRRGNADHRQLNQVRRRTLQRRVGRRPLPECPDVETLVLELRDIAPPPEQRLHVSFLARLGHGPVEPRPHTCEPLKVAPDEFLGLFQGDPQLARQGERPLPVDGREVDGLGPRAHLGCNLLLRHAENEGGSLPVNVARSEEHTSELQSPVHL